MTAGNNWVPKDPEVARLLDRVRALEAEVHGWAIRREASQTERRTRTWQVILACVTGVVLPLLSIGVLALIHLITRS